MKYGLTTLALVLIAGTAWAFIDTASYKKNVKMTVTVETPEGDVIGSAVREISNEAPIIELDWPHGGNPAVVRGEAVVIDLGEKGKLFALIDKNGEASRFYHAFSPPGGHPQSEAAFRYFADLPVGTSAILDQDYWPRFVTFTDMNTLKSIEHVNVSDKDSEQYIEKIFGEGAQLKNIILETTNEAVTQSQILAILPKFNDEFWKWRSTIKYGDPREISPSDFVREN